MKNFGQSLKMNHLLILMNSLMVNNCHLTLRMNSLKGKKCCFRSCAKEYSCCLNVQVLVNCFVAEPDLLKKNCCCYGEVGRFLKTLSYWVVSSAEYYCCRVVNFCLTVELPVYCSAHCPKVECFCI